MWVIFIEMEFVFVNNRLSLWIKPGEKINFGSCEIVLLPKCINLDSFPNLLDDFGHVLGSESCLFGIETGVICCFDIAKDLKHGNLIDGTHSLIFFFLPPFTLGRLETIL